MKAKVEFQCELTVGIFGFALMKLEESFINPPDWAPKQCECVKNDLEMCGIEDWVHYALDDVPTEPGAYVFTGKAEFDEDSGDYSATCANV